MTTRAHEGERVDFIDGVVFSATECYLTLARWTDDLEGRVRPSDYTGDQVFYRSIQTRRRDLLTAHDYLWRWDTDWFWCSRAFGAQVPAVRRLWPRHLLRSDVYWRIVAFENRHRVIGRIDRLRGQPDARARRAGRRDPARPHGRVRGVVPARGADRADLALPHPASSSRRAAGEATRASDRPGRSTRCAPTSATSTSASGRPSPSRPAQPTVTSTAPSSGRSPSTAATSRSTPTPTTTRPPSPGSTATRHTGPSSGDTTRTGGCPRSTRRRCRRDDDDGGRGVRRIFGDGDSLPPRGVRRIDRRHAVGRVVRLKSVRGLNYLLTAPGELGLARAYLTGDLEFDGLDEGDPYEVMRLADGGLVTRRLGARDAAELVGLRRPHGRCTCPSCPTSRRPVRCAASAHGAAARPRARRRGDPPPLRRQQRASTSSSSARR